MCYVFGNILLFRDYFFVANITFYESHFIVNDIASYHEWNEKSKLRWKVIS